MSPLKKNKIVCVCIPSFTNGGAENQSFLIARIIKSMEGFEPLMFSFSRRDDTVSIYEKEGIPYIQHPCPVLLTDNYFVKIFKIIKLILVFRKMKIFMIISSTFHSNLSVGLAWKYSGVKYFLWRQAGLEKEVPLTKWERYIIKKKPNYICNSEWVKKYLISRHSLDENDAISVIKNAVYEREIQKSREDWRKSLGIEKEAVVMTMAANFFPEKDFATLIRAFDQVINKVTDRKLYLIFAGNAPGRSPARNEMKTLALELKLQDSVIFVDNTPDVFGLYYASDIGVLSTLSEGFSNSLIEYLFCGLPVVATNIPPNIEAVPDDTKRFLFAPGDIVGCSAMLEELILKENLRISLGKINSDWAKDRYGIKRFNEQYKMLLTHLGN